MKLLALWLGVALAQAPAQAPAQSTPKPPVAASQDPVSRALYQYLAHGKLEARVGQWVTYRLHGGAGREAFWRMAMVGEQKDARGRPADWVEMEFGEDPRMAAPMVQMKLLVAKDGGLAKSGNVSRLIVSVGLTQPQEVAPNELAQWFAPDPDSTADAMPTADDRRLSRDLHLRQGREAQLMTQAGTIKALPTETLYRQTVLQRVWVSPEVPLFALAKLELPPLDHSLELYDFGANAKPRMHAPLKGAPVIGAETPVPTAPVVHSKPKGPDDAHPTAQP